MGSKATRIRNGILAGARVQDYRKQTMSISEVYVGTLQISPKRLRPAFISQSTVEPTTHLGKFDSP